MPFAALADVLAILIVPAIGFVVWLLSMLFRNATQPPQPPNRTRRPPPPARDAEEPQRQTSSDLDRFISDTRRQREQDERRVQRPAQGAGAPRQRRPVILEEVEEQPRPALRPAYVPPRPPAPPRPVARPVPVMRPPAPVLEVADSISSAPVMQAVVATALPTMPVQPLAPVDVLERVEAADAPLLLYMKEMLGSPQSAQTAFALREIFDAPLCRRKRP